MARHAQAAAAYYWNLLPHRHSINAAQCHPASHPTALLTEIILDQYLLQIAVLDFSAAFKESLEHR